MALFDDLEARGLVFQCTAPEELKARLEKGPLTVYAGFDPTADGLHVGNLVPLLALARFQRAGHRAIALAGGATGRIGDPSGKAEERALRTEEEIGHNIAAIKEELKSFLDLADPKRGLLVDNADWTRPVSFLDFLRDIGKNFSVNEMIKKDSVRVRLEERDQGISFTEFSYMLLQAFDFLHLSEEEGCELQIGGSDQWGNITAGTSLIRRKQQKTAFGLTVPLVTDAEGKKFGKTEKGAVWLSPKKTSPYRFYQFWINTPDGEVVKLLKLFTFLPLEEITRLAEVVQKEPARREAQKALASEMTRLVHGEEELNRAKRASEALFGGSLEGLDERTLLEIAEDAPKSAVARSRFEGEGFGMVELLTETGVMPSKGEARRKLEGKGIYLNNAQLDKSAPPVTADKLLFGRYLLLRKGKKDYHLVVAE
jgi:tyrosyl-tRNA synthetase